MPTISGNSNSAAVLWLRSIPAAAGWAMHRHRQHLTTQFLVRHMLKPNPTARIRDEARFMLTQHGPQCVELEKQMNQPQRLAPFTRPILVELPGMSSRLTLWRAQPARYWWRIRRSASGTLSPSWPSIPIQFHCPTDETQSPVTDIH